MVSCNIDDSKRPSNSRWSRGIFPYIRVLKPRETVLLTFIGLCSGLVAGASIEHFEIGRILLATLALLLGNGGTNGLTNYIDRDLDARMERVRHRPLPSKQIDPPQKMLPWAISLVIAGLIIAWFLHWLCFTFAAAGVIVAITFRKRVTCVFPQGALAGCAPVFIGYTAISKDVDLTLLFLCLLITIWIPLHVWSLMISHRDDYRQAGITYFPLSLEVKDSVKMLPVLAVLLVALSLALYFVGHFHWLYLATACFMGILTITSTTRLIYRKLSSESWKIYKLTAFPYLGILFLAMALDVWLL
ncbi:MAG: UbiA family prenyltransferase [Dehalococcoidia bacterium]|jgi:protoheme IX farnesyltransferase